MIFTLASLKIDTAFLYLFLMFFVMGMGCNKEREATTIRIVDHQENFKNSWDALVEDSTKINLTDSGLSQELSSITQIVFF